MVDATPLQGGEPSDAGEPASWLFGDGNNVRACHLIPAVLTVRRCAVDQIDGRMLSTLVDALMDF